MNYDEYKRLFDDILNHPNPGPPYNDEKYFNYTKLNRSRMNRSDKYLELNEVLVSHIKNISKPQHWIIITEPWCGDAAHIVSFLIKLTTLNDLVTYDIQLRDSEPSLIENYLTNGSKSIPKLIVRNANNPDDLVWGPRPKEAMEIAENMKSTNAPSEDIKVALQNWYNHDKGQSLYAELLDHFVWHDNERLGEKQE